MNCPHCGHVINPAQELAYMRKDSLTPERRKEIALKAVQARWKRFKKDKPKRV